MNIKIRETKEVDMEAVFKIRTDPLVTPHQFRLSAGDTLESWTQQLTGGASAGGPKFDSVTVWLDSQIVGHISQYTAKYGDEMTTYCGWNLAPEYWGQGIMFTALERHFEDLFARQATDVVIADCFSGNKRCLRLLRKLGFVPLPIDLSGRIQIFMANKCWHWIHRFQLRRPDTGAPDTGAPDTGAPDGIEA